jgi:hypothetical protein
MEAALDGSPLPRGAVVIFGDDPLSRAPHRGHATTVAPSGARCRARSHRSAMELVATHSAPLACPEDRLALSRACTRGDTTGVGQPAPRAAIPYDPEDGAGRGRVFNSQWKSSIILALPPGGTKNPTHRRFLQSGTSVENDLCATLHIPEVSIPEILKKGKSTGSRPTLPSSRTRGAVPTTTASAQHARTIPAYAGSTLTHPTGASPTGPPSPRTRGAVPTTTASAQHARTIPAYAGSTLTHPTGASPTGPPSPRTRGAVPTTTASAQHARTIPAYAGSTLTHPTGVTRAEDHPRTAGAVDC